MPKFSASSQEKLNTCHSDLNRLFSEVVKYMDCTILEGERSQEKQDKAFSEGKSQAQYPNSNHNTKPSNAVDVVPYPVDWNNIERFYEFAGFVKGVASQMGIKIKWGGDFKSFFDGPHFEVY